MFVEVQQEGNPIKYFFRQSEMSSMLKDCHAGVQQALEVFKMDATIFTSATEMHKAAEAMHKELLELISKLSDGTMSDRSSSVYQHLDDSQSSKSFSILPSKPKIFHGRESELAAIVKTLNQESPRIAILGASGMGKTSLARAALHHPDVAAKYEHRVFVGCDAANNSIEIAALLGASLGLKTAKDLMKPIIRYFASRSPSLLIIDNLETSWEPSQSRGGVEEFLSLLADVKHLALIVTMRGTERPAKVRWTRPFLQPLEPLTDHAAWQTFIDIADDSHDTEDIKHLLHLTDNMPLAVDLIAHLVDAEGCSNVLSRWETERTTLLSNGHDKRSSLDASIALSLSSSRMHSPPGTKDLLSLLSILPNGLSDIELLQSKLPIQQILGCKTTLLRTSLAYIDANKRLKSLVPIREHILHFHPPTTHLIEPLWKHFHLLLELCQKYSGTMQMASEMNQITLNIKNLQQILRQGLHPDSPHLSDTIECTISLNSFSRIAGHGWLDLMDVIPSLLPQLSNHRLEVQLIIETLYSLYYHPVPTPELLIHQAISHFHDFNDPLLECFILQPDLIIISAKVIHQ
ncbi:P-loop containing nucleoside triphosphate hydrolase protein [Mycena latifolia]|nr:P-loop containing nucleoside triphosphate hydrolase protein [Mycena latifolia]